jgi:hypothetical protein
MFGPPPVRACREPTSPAQARVFRKLIDGVTDRIGRREGRLRVALSDICDLAKPAASGFRQPDDLHPLRLVGVIRRRRSAFSASHSAFTCSCGMSSTSGSASSRNPAASNSAAARAERRSPRGCPATGRSHQAGGRAARHIPPAGAHRPAARRCRRAGVVVRLPLSMSAWRLRARTNVTESQSRSVRHATKKPRYAGNNGTAGAGAPASSAARVEVRRWIRHIAPPHVGFAAPVRQRTGCVARTSLVTSP